MKHVLDLEIRMAKSTQRLNELEFTEENSNTSEKLMIPEKNLTHKETFISPFEFRNLIKAEPRKTNRKRRKPGRSMIPTDTPEKDQLEQEKITVRRTSLKNKKLLAKY